MTTVYTETIASFFLLKIEQVEKFILLEKKAFKLCEDLGFNITVDTSLKTVKYLDVKLVLRYVNVKLNHPRWIINKISIGIELGLSRILSSKDIFNNIKHVCQCYRKKAT